MKLIEQKSSFDKSFKPLSNVDIFNICQKTEIDCLQFDSAVIDRNEGCEILNEGVFWKQNELYSVKFINHIFVPLVQDRIELTVFFICN